MVPSTRELLPDPDTPVNTVSAPLRTSTDTSRRLFVRALRTSLWPLLWEKPTSCPVPPGIGVSVIDRAELRCPPVAPWLGGPSSSRLWGVEVSRCPLPAQLWERALRPSR